MKLFLATIVLASTLQFLTSEVHGAPSEITSEQLGNVVQQLQQIMIKAEMESNLAGEQNKRPSAHSKMQADRPHGFGGLQIQSSNQLRDRASVKEFGAKARSQEEQASMQVQGVSIVNCGAAGNIINSALSVLNVLFPTQFGVLVNCAISPGCVQVEVDVPANDVLVDIDVCDLGGGEACVQVYVEPTSPCSGAGLIPIVIPIPLSGGKQILIDIRIIPEIKFFGFVVTPGCATVKVDAPQC